jgi:hypothetical protein
MLKREDTYGVVYRKVSEDLRVTNVFGKKEIVTKTCSCCAKTLTVSSFYLESKTKRKNNNQTRKQCIVCWDKYKGANPAKVLSDTSLDLFLGANVPCQL